MLDLYLEEILGDDEEKKKQRKKAIKTIKKQQFRQNTYDMLSKNVGKGEKNSLKRIRVMNNANEVVTEY